MATYGVDFFGCWRVFVNGKCIGAFATRADAKKFTDEWNAKNNA